jgi:energy-coupling factor transport system ATP-binding protein
MLPQHPQSLFTHDTLREDLLDSAGDNAAAVETWAKRLELDRLFGRHPFDLSGGELQRAGVCKLLLQKADTLLLDEPTKGLDAYMKLQLAEILQELNGLGVTLLMVTHDVEFAASRATRCAMLFDGLIVSEDEPHAFFAGNRFYTTAANQIADEYFKNAITCEEVVSCCRASFTASEPLRHSG